MFSSVVASVDWCFYLFLVLAIAMSAKLMKVALQAGAAYGSLNDITILHVQAFNVIA